MCYPNWKWIAAYFISVFCLACTATAPTAAPDPSVRESIRQLNKGVVQYTKGCYAAALQQFNESHEWFTAADHLPGMAQSLHSMGNTYLRLEDIDSALLAYDEAIDLYGFMQDDKGLVNVLTSKAAALMEAGKRQQAANLLDQADAIAGKNDFFLSALRLKTRGLLLFLGNQLHQSEALLHQALNQADPQDDSLKASIHYALGQVLLAQQQPSRARDHFESALSLDRIRGASFDIAKDLSALGMCADQLGENERAAILFKRSVKIYALLQNSSQVKKSMAYLQSSAAEAGIDTAATRYWVNQWLAGHMESNLCR